MLPEMNFIAIILAAFIPTVIGFVYYHPKVFGTAWMNLSGLTEEKLKTGNMPVIIGVSIVLSFLIALAVMQMSIHQMHIYSLFQSPDGLPEAGTEGALALDEVMRVAGDNFRTFKHGALHGALVGIFFVFPIIAINGMFERKKFKLNLIHGLYWAITLSLMGGVLCQFV